MAKTALSPDAETLALLAALGAQPLTRIATVTGAGCAVLAALHQRDDAEILLVDLGEGGRFGRADWPEACRDRLLAQMAGRPHILNLGHGIDRFTPISHVEQLLRRLRSPGIGS